MTLRVYQGWARHAERPSRRYLNWLIWLALLTSTSAQFLFPFFADLNQQLLLLTGAYAAAILSLLHALREFGVKYFALIGISLLLFGFAVFETSARTAWPFGHVQYWPALGRVIDQAPAVLPFALLGMAYPMFLLGRQLSSRWPAVIGGFGFVAWDLLIDPVLTHNQYWQWDANVTRTPGIPETPLSNTAGMFLISIAAIQILQWLMPRERSRASRSIASTPIDLLLILGCAAGIFNNLYLNNSKVALIAGSLYLLVLLPYLVSKWLTRA